MKLRFCHNQCVLWSITRLPPSTHFQQLTSILYQLYSCQWHLQHWQHYPHLCICQNSFHPPTLPSLSGNSLIPQDSCLNKLTWEEQEKRLLSIQIITRASVAVLVLCLMSQIIHDNQEGVSLTFRELSKIFSGNLCVAEIALSMRISSWNFVHVTKAWLWAHTQSFSLKFSP